MHTHARTRMYTHSIPSQHAAHCANCALDKIKEIFDEFDEDHSGKLDPKEFKKLVSKVNPLEKWTDDELKAAMADLDPCMFSV